MNYEEAASVLRTRFEAAWADRTPKAMPNVGFDPAVDAPNGTYVKFNIGTAGADQVASGAPGNNPHRHYGMVTIEVYAPENEGDADAHALADAACAVFRGFKSGHLRCRLPPFERTLGNDRGSYRVNVMAPFEFDGFF